jgi:rhodanese-related sulfurtransferase
MSDVLELTPTESKAKLDGGAVLIDVREPEEFAAARVEGAQLVPMQSVPAELQRLEGLADESDLVVMCHHGVRSLQVVLWLRQHGLENCWSVTGGIDRWSREVDRSVPTY